MQKILCYALFAVALVVMFPALAQNECRLTFSGYEGTETLTDFPALIKIPDGLTGFDYNQSIADGSDLVFFGTDGKPRECAYAHYRHVKRLPPEKMKHLCAAILRENRNSGGFETWGIMHTPRDRASTRTALKHVPAPQASGCPSAVARAAKRSQEVALRAGKQISGVTRKL